jgi:hypothetical protein
MRVDDVGLGLEVIVPQILEQHGAGHHVAGMAHQIFEQLELLRLQLDLAAAARDPAGHHVDLQIADRKRALRRRDPRAPHQRIEPGSQLAERERLGQIVVPACAQAANAVVDLGQGAQDEDRRALPGLTQHLDDGEPVDLAGQHAVHDDHVVRFARREEHSVAPVGRMIGGVARLLQSLDDELADALVVLDQQELHGVSPTGGPDGEAPGDDGSSWAACSRLCLRFPFIQRLNSSRYK